MLEKEIQNTICDYLALKMNQGKLMFWRQNTAPTVQKTGDVWQFRRMAKHTLKGVSDIIVVKEGKPIFLEVKREKTKQSPEQLEFQRLVQNNGGYYYVVRSVEDVISVGL